MKNIAKALSEFHLKVDKISKDAINPFFKSNYASLPNVLDAIREPLQEAGLTFTQLPMGENGLKTILFHVETGEMLESEMSMTPSKQDPQGAGSALTYMRRYALVSILGLNVDDDDGNAASKKPKVTKQTVKAAEAAQERTALHPAHIRWDEAKKGIANKSVSLAQIKKTYTLTPQYEAMLINSVQQPQT